MQRFWPFPIKFMSSSVLAPMLTLPINESTELNEWSLYIRGSQRDVVYPGWPIASSYMSPNAGGGVAESQQMSTAVHCTWSPNKLWRSNSVFNLCSISFITLLSLFSAVHQLFNYCLGKLISNLYFVKNRLTDLKEVAVARLRCVIQAIHVILYCTHCL